MDKIPNLKNLHVSAWIDMTPPSPPVLRMRSHFDGKCERND